MTTLKDRIAEAAFWEGFVCLACGHIVYDETEAGDTCPVCESPEFIRATTVKGIQARLESDDERWEE